MAVLEFSIGERIRVTKPDGYDLGSDALSLEAGDIGHVGDVWMAEDGTYFVCRFPNRFFPAGYYLRPDEIESAPLGGQLTL